MMKDLFLIYKFKKMAFWVSTLHLLKIKLWQ